MSASASAPVAPRRRRLRVVRDLVVVVLVAVLASFLIKTFLVRSFFIPSGSMENTLQVGDRILVDELDGTLLPLHRGDVIVFSDPGGWLEAQPLAAPGGPGAAVVDRLLPLVGLSSPGDDDHLVKRVIGLPGDHVRCCDALGRMSVNGVPLDEPYVHHDPGVTAASETPFAVTVPSGHLWVMGDNRDHSCDSRCHILDPGHGYVPEADVVGRAVVVSWPIAHWAVLSDYAATFAGIPSPSRKAG